MSNSWWIASLPSMLSMSMPCCSQNSMISSFLSLIALVILSMLSTNSTYSPTLTPRATATGAVILNEPSVVKAISCASASSFLLPTDTELNPKDATLFSFTLNPMIFKFLRLMIKCCFLLKSFTFYSTTSASSTVSSSSSESSLPATIFNSVVSITPIIISLAISRAA